MRIPISTVLLSGLLVAFGAAQAQDHTLEQLVVEMASSAAEHNAVSKHYTAQAEAARQDLHRHEEMARIYGNAGRTGQPQMRQHCEQLAKKYGEIAAEYDELARLHAEEARKLTH
jgi:gamma-glutamyltranspeptidase